MTGPNKEADDQLDQSDHLIARQDINCVNYCVLMGMWNNLSSAFQKVQRAAIHIHTHLYIYDVSASR